jgi:hypothetical protein
VDDWSASRSYLGTIFRRHDRPAGADSGVEFELFVLSTSLVNGRLFSSATGGRLGTVSRTHSAFSVPEPDFDFEYRPRHRSFEGVGYRVPSVVALPPPSQMFQVKPLSGGSLRRRIEPPLVALRSLSGT